MTADSNQSSTPTVLSAAEFWNKWINTLEGGVGLLLTTEPGKVCFVFAEAYADHRNAALRSRIAELELALAGREAQLHMTVARLGGTVEGYPTAMLNFLQRVDELRQIEARCAKLDSAFHKLSTWQLSDPEERAALQQIVREALKGEK
jgi:hypothetical protein